MKVIMAATIGLAMLWGVVGGYTMPYPVTPGRVAVVVTSADANRVVHAPTGEFVQVRLSAPFGWVWWFQSVASSSGAIHWTNQDFFFVQGAGSGKIVYALKPVGSDRIAQTFAVTVLSP